MNKKEIEENEKAAKRILAMNEGRAATMQHLRENWTPLPADALLKPEEEENKETDKKKSTPKKI
jgi:hypothetical protein